MRIEEMSAMIRKERLVLANSMGETRAVRIALFAMLFAGGALLPFLIGPYMLSHLGFLIVFPLLGAVFVTHHSIDAICGERERKTLETLLATPVSNAAIVLGKTLVIVAAAVVVGVGNIVLAIALVNAGHWNGSLQLPALHHLAWLPLLSLAIALCAIHAAFHSSLLAKTTRQATQWLTLFWLVILIVPAVGFVLLPSSWSQPLANWWAAQSSARLLPLATLGAGAIGTLLWWLNLRALGALRIGK